MIKLKYLSKDGWNELDRYLIDISRKSSSLLNKDFSIIEDTHDDHPFLQTPLHFVDGSRRIYKEYNALVDDKYFCFGAFGAINAGIVNATTKEIKIKQENIFTFPDIEDIDTPEDIINGQVVRLVKHDSGTSSREKAKEIINNEMLALEERLVAESLSSDKTIIMDGRARVMSVPNDNKWCFGHVKSFQSMPPKEIIHELKALDFEKRTSVFYFNKSKTYRWYVKHKRLPQMDSSSIFNYVSRVEVMSDEPIENINAIATAIANTIVEYGTSPQISSRWPQNLYPVEFLEKRLKSFFISNHIMELSLP